MLLHLNFQPYVWNQYDLFNIHHTNFSFFYFRSSMFLENYFQIIGKFYLPVLEWPWTFLNSIAISRQHTFVCRCRIKTVCNWTFIVSITFPHLSLFFSLSKPIVTKMTKENLFVPIIILEAVIIIARHVINDTEKVQMI